MRIKNTIVVLLLLLVTNKAQAVIVLDDEYINPDKIILSGSFKDRFSSDNDVIQVFVNDRYISFYAVDRYNVTFSCYIVPGSTDIDFDQARVIVNNAASHGRSLWVEKPRTSSNCTMIESGLFSDNLLKLTPN